MSGIAAAAVLAAANLSVAVLEAKATVGGRVYATRFGAAATNTSIVIELGANWIHGIPAARSSASDQGPRSRNPVWELAKEIGLKARRIPGSSMNVSGYGLFFANGTEPVESSKHRRRARAAAALDCLNRTSLQRQAAGLPDVSMASALAASCDWEAKDELDRALEWEITSANGILSPGNLSLKWTLPEPTYAMLGPDDTFVHDQRPRGYAAVLDRLVDRGELGPRLRFGFEVASVELRKPGERGGAGGVVTSATGARAVARTAVISTIPLGAMQQMHRTIFQQPPLPARQVDALGQFTMGNFTKIFAQWPTRFWDGRGPQWLVGRDHDTADDRGSRKVPPGPLEFHDVGILVEPDASRKENPNTLFCYVVGDASAIWEGLSDDEAAAALAYRLSRAFRRQIPLPSAFKMTRHGSDPLMRGAYSATTVGVAGEEVAAMAAPLGWPRAPPQLYFGGEHVCAAYQGYLHGAYFAGLRAADDVLRRLEKAPPAGLAYGGECEDGAPGQRYARP